MTRTPVPTGMQVQFGRFFGDESQERKVVDKTDGEWRRALLHVLDHLYRYLCENVHTDEVHWLMLCSGLASAHRAIEEDEDFWAGYAEGMTRMALLLMGDYPDHRNRRPGSRTTEHFKLSRMRTCAWRQDGHQKLSTLVAARGTGMIPEEADPMRALHAFRVAVGFKPGYREFIDWYRREFPDAYAAVF